MKYVIIGGGVAGVTAAENIRKIDQGGQQPEKEGDDGHCC